MMREKREPLTIWFITVGFMDDNEMFRPCATVAFYKDKEDALEALKTNNADIHEAAYDYAVLEEAREGCYGVGYSDPEWFKYDMSKDGYFHTATPKDYEHTSGFWS